MKKLLIIPVLLASLQAQDFDSFLKDALLNSPYLKANQLNISQANERASITQRYKNPSLSLEISNFDIDLGTNESGYSVGLVQPLRLWGVSNDRKELATAQRKEAKNLVQLSRARFVLKISLLYSRYKRALNLEALSEKELEISTKILNISKARFENGTIARVKYIQSRVDMQRVSNSLNLAQVNRLSTYYRLIGFSGSTKEIHIQNDYEFTLHQNISTKNSAQLAYIKSKSVSASAKAELNSNRLEWIKVYGSFEKEPDQGIARVGVNIPLAIFNTKTQEREIARLESKKAEFIAQNMTNTFTIKLKALGKSVHTLEKLQISTFALLESQEELLGMYEDGYKIANIDLIELQVIKNQMIQTQANSIEIKFSKEQNIIQHNFLTGEYNE